MALWESLNVSGNSSLGNTSLVNITHLEEPYFCLECYFVPVVFALIFFVGLIGNGTLIFIVLRHKEMRTTPNIFILSLALGDFLMILVSVPFYSVIYTYPAWIYGVFLCKLNAFLKALSLGVSVFTLTALSGDRFMAIMYPMRRHLESPIPRTPLIAAAIWVLSMAFAMFDCVVMHVQDPAGMPVCDTHLGSKFERFRAWIRFVVYFLVPVLIITVLYTLMAHSLWISHTDQSLMSSVQGQASNRQTEARKRIAKLVLFMVFLFIVCWLPRHIYLLWYHDPDSGPFTYFWAVWKVISYCLCFLNSCINPFALYLLSDQFRKYYDRYLFCGWRKRRGFGRAGTNGYQGTTAPTRTSRVTDESHTTSSLL